MLANTHDPIRLSGVAYLGDPPILVADKDRIGKTPIDRMARP